MAWIPIGNAWAAVWASALGRAVWQGTLCLGVVGLLCRVCPRLPAAGRAWLWWLVCLKFTAGLLCVTPPSLPLLPAASVALGARITPQAFPSGSGSSRVLHAFRPATAPSEQSFSPKLTAKPLPAAPVSPALLLCLAWVVGVLLTLAQAGRRRAMLRRQMGWVSFPHAARIVETDAALGPMVTGLIRPVIWLPKGKLNTQERAMALAHEQAHLHRGDLWLGLLPALTETLFFFFPPVRWAVREYGQAREEACDADAIRATGATAADYARLLLRFASADHPAPALGFGPGYQALRRRLTLLPQAGRSWSPGARRAAALGLVLAFPAVLPWQLTAAVNRSLARSVASLPDPRTLRFTLTDLGAVEGGETDAMGLNNGGQVVGCVETTPPSVYGQAFLWDRGQVSALDALPGDRFCRANDINDRGQVIASSYSAYDHNQAFVWQNGQQTPLSGPSGFPHTKALGISNNGWVAGYGQTGDYDQKRELIAHAAVWDAQGRPTDLGTLGGDYSAAYGVNDHGQVVGKADTSYFGSTHAFLWQNGHMNDLGTLGGANSLAVRVNNAGQAVGYSETTNGAHAFLWQNGQMHDLGTLPRGTESQAQDINDRGQIVGESGGQAALWQSNRVVNLNQLVPARAGWTLQDATAINARGQIAGRGLAPDGHVHAFLLTPFATKK